MDTSFVVIPTKSINPANPMPDLENAPISRLIVFTRYPAPGRTKTRLIPVLGPAGAADLQRRMTEGLMGRALSAAFAEGAPAAALIGADIPDLSTAILAEAFQRLADHDIVIGPAADGGYYLVGARRERYAELAPLLFQGIPWGTGRVLRDTLAALAAAHVRVHLLPLLRDIDRPEDLAAWEAAEP